MARDKLPNRRAGETREFRLHGVSYRATLGFYPDGRLGEVFLTGGKIGSNADVAVRDSAILASIALQYGVPLTTLSGALTRDEAGRADGPLGLLLDELVVESAEV